jgi:hypothetical protein
LGIAQREIKAQRSPDEGIMRNRKARGIAPNTRGERIRFWRMKRALTQRQLSRATGIPLKQLQKIESDLAVPAEGELTAIKRVLEVFHSVHGTDGEQ